MGVSLDPAGSEEKGALLMAVPEGGPAAKADIQDGDLVTAWNGRPIRSAADLVRRIGAAKPGDEVRLKIRRGDEVIFADVKLGKRF
jgi:Trypsin-like serine proteases, typically periplasmic, contain C-terminal PDZ domain